MRSLFEALLGRGRRERAETSYPPGHVPPRPMPAPAVHVTARADADVREWIDRGLTAREIAADIARARAATAPAAATPRTPAVYQRATWYCTLPHDTAAGEIGFALLPVGAALPQRFALPTEHAVHLLESLALSLGYELSKCEAGSQSPMSELMPSAPRSVPSDGEKQCPPAASSIA